MQRLKSQKTYCVTLNDDGRVSSDHVIARMRYAHPLYTADGMDARRRLHRLNGQRRTFYCGAYLGSGFHEDGVRAGLEAARLLNAQRVAA